MEAMVVEGAVLMVPGGSVLLGGGHAWWLLP